MSGRWGGGNCPTLAAAFQHPHPLQLLARRMSVRPSVGLSVILSGCVCVCVCSAVSPAALVHTEQSSAAARRRWSPPLAPWAGWRLDNLSECRPVSMSSTRFRHATIRRARTTILRSRVVGLRRSICERITTSSLTVKVAHTRLPSVGFRS